MLNRILLLILVAILSSCSNGLKEKIGAYKDSPDEFKVVSAPPLVIPPTFDLRPPEGMKNYDDEYAAPVEKVRVYGKTENLLLSKMGDQSDPEIRSIINKELPKKKSEEDKNFLDKIRDVFPEKKSNNNTINPIEEHKKLNSKNVKLETE
jgi:hypothetical protein